MFNLTVTKEISAGHFLRDYSGPCANQHGHNYHLEVTFQCQDDELDEHGFVIDCREAKEYLKRFDHVNLNDLEEFKDKNPTMENLAVTIGKKLGAAIVLIKENEGNECTWINDEL